MTEKTLETAKREKNVEIKERLRRLLTEWKKEGGAGDYLSSEKIAEMFQTDTGIIMQGRTIDNYINPSNNNGVPLPFLCWCAKKRGVSLDYLITGTSYTPKRAEESTGATPEEVLDALQLLLRTFENRSQLIEYPLITTVKPEYSDELTTETRTAYAIGINSLEIQELLDNWNQYLVSLEKPKFAKRKEKFRKLLFEEPLQNSIKTNDTISEAGVFYNSSEEPAFVNLPSSQVPLAVPKNQMDIFKIKYEFNVFEQYYSQDVYIEHKNPNRVAMFSSDSNWNLTDVDKENPEPEGIITPYEELLPF